VDAGILERLSRVGLIGRTEELDRIEQGFEADGGLLLIGVAGIGKTTLWRAGVELARERGYRVLTAAPAEAEQTFSFAVLNDLLGTVGEEVLAVLPPHQRRAIDRVLTVADAEEATNVHVVGVAVRNVLGALAEGGGVAIAIDDVQWTDAASVAVLEFALRRTSAAHVLVAVRKGCALPLRLPLATLEVGPMTLTALHHLLVERLGVAWSRAALQRVHEVAGGNPFYALELARANPSGGELVLPDSLQELATGRVSPLPEATRRGLAELAIAGTVGPSAELGPAVEERVVESYAGVWRFSHPLLAEAAVSLLDQDERRALHRDIAARMVEPERRARHLARAADGPDEAVALELAQAAERAGRSGALAASAELWELAAGLTEPAQGTLAAERFVEAGIAHKLAWNSDAANSLLEANLDRLPPGPLRQRGLMHLAIPIGAPRDMRALVPELERALAEAEDAQVRLEVSQMLAAFHEACGDSLEAGELARAHLREVELEDGARLVDALWFSAFWEISCDRPPWALIERARSLPPTGASGGWPIHPEPREVVARALLRDGRIDEAHALLAEWLTQVGDAVSIYTHHGLFRLLATVELAAGRFRAAASIADELLSEGEQTGNPVSTCEGLLHDATAASLLGETEWARKRATRALEFAEAIWLAVEVSDSLATLGLLELSLGNVAEAAALYRRVPPGGWQRWFYLAGGRAALDAVEAFSAIGELDSAHDLIATLPADARELPVAEACVAAAEGRLERAVELVQSVAPAPSPFRHGRELLLLGRLQRQARHRGDARETLEAARGEFEQLEARPWIARTDEELSRLGGRSPAGATLTESERRVAALVASGLSNKEVASRLVVTVRTVEAHLTKIYAKLGIRSRAALTARWPEL